MANIWSRIKARLSWLRIKSFARNHKIASVIIVLIIIFAGYKIYGYFTNTSGEPRYVIAAVNKGTIISTISGAGQVSASNQLDITNKVSGDLVYLGVTAGQKVSAGTLIAQIDARDAQANLESAQIALSKLQKPADKLSLVQAQNALASALNAETKAYSDGFSAVDTTFLDLPDIMTGLDNLFNNYNASTYFTHDWALSDAAKADRQKALASYSRALAAYNHNLTDYHGASRTSASSTIQALVEETAQTARLVTQALKDTNSAVAYVIDQTDVSKRTSTMTTDTSNLNTWTNTMNANVTSLNNLADTIDSSTRDIADKQEALIKLQAGTDALDLRSQELVVEQRQNALNDYYIRAPFSGTIAKLEVKNGEQATAGQATVSMINSGLFQVESYVPEINIANIKVGNLAKITLDAYGQDIVFEATVISIDPTETIRDGVSTYKVELQFKTEDIRIKSGMTANIAITTINKPQVISVPPSAIITENGQKFIELKIDNKLIKQSVTIGDVGALGQTEIVTGLKVGDIVVTNPKLP